jgi:hypothetical protein
LKGRLRGIQGKIQMQEKEFELRGDDGSWMEKPAKEAKIVLELAVSEKIERTDLTLSCEI